MPKHRSRLEIIADILSLVERGDILRTHIMYKANLNYDQLKEYISFLIERDLIIWKPRVEMDDNSMGRYALTSNGRKYLDQYRKLEEIYQETIN